MTAQTALANEGRSTLAGLAWSLRPYQWPKNIIVFAAFAFSAGEAWHLDSPGTWWPLLWRVAVLFGCWCLASSAIYLVNDVRDREVDRIHPRKRLRPIASGEVTPQGAIALAAVIGVGGVAIALGLDPEAGLVLAGYLGVMVLYSMGLKHVAVLDVLILSAGVVARAVSGALVIDVAISPWLYVCTSFGAFFVATSKRWAEVKDLGVDAVRHRASLALYSGETLGQMVVASAAGALLSFAIYTIESEHVPQNGAMAATIPFVAFAMFRYLLLINGPRQGDAPDRILFTDPQIIAAVAGFSITAIWVLLAT